MFGRLVLAAASVVLLASCQIVTVLDVNTPGATQRWYWGVHSVEAWPGGGFVASECGFDAAFTGEGVVLVRPGQPIWSVRACLGELDVVPAPDGSAVYLSALHQERPDVTGVWRIDVASKQLTRVWTPPPLEGQEFARAGVGAIDIAADGTIYIGAQRATGGQEWTIRKITGPTTTTVVPGSVGLGRADFELVADGLVTIVGEQVVHLGTSGARRVVAGTGTRGFSGDGGPAVAAQLSRPRDLSVTPAGGILVVDTGNARVRLVKADGTITTSTGGGVPPDWETGEPDPAPANQAGFESISGVASDTVEGCYWVSDTRYERGTVRYVGGPSCPGRPG